MAGVAVYPPGATFGPRRLLDFEFVWLMAGSAAYRAGDIWYEAPEGSIILCRPVDSDFFRWDETSSTRHAYFHFGIAGVPAGWPDVDQWPLVQSPKPDGILSQLFRHIIACADRGDAELTEIAIAHLLTAFVKGIAGDRVPRDAIPEPVDRALLFMMQRLGSDPASSCSLQELAGAACVTPEHLCRIFRQATGYTPLQAVRYARLDQAAALLARSNYSVGEIAALCGFANQFHFSRCFRQAYLVSPRELRNQVRLGSPVPLSRLVRIVNSN